MTRNPGEIMGNKENFDEKSDEELVLASLDHRDNFLYIVKRYKLKLFRYVRRITSVSEEEAEDILQEVFLKVYLNLNSFDKDMKFSSWIYRIAHNQVVSNFRKSQARPQISEIDLSDDRMINIADDLNMEKEVDNNILRANISKALKKLDTKHREAAILKFFDEKDYREISDILKIPMGTVASRISKAKQELKKIIMNLNINQ